MKINTINLQIIIATRNIIVTTFWHTICIYQVKQIKNSVKRKNSMDDGLFFLKQLLIKGPAS